VDAAEAPVGFLATADPGRPLPLPDKTAKMLREDMAGGRPGLPTPATAIKPWQTRGKPVLSGAK
jgi:hypothetical protein